MLYDQIQEAAQAIRSRWPGTPRAGIILGTGLGGLVEDIQDKTTIPYGEIPHFPRSTVQSHAGRLVCGQLGGKPVMAMEGRVHFYEGGTLQELTFPVRVMKPFLCAS
jgi:purine-nucleoside phosphorylase